jgi:two-component system chemotaxis response regulator CheY
MERSNDSESEREVPSFQAKKGGNEKIALIIDDSRVNQDVLTSYLHEAGYTTASAVDGEEGFERFNTIHPSITFLDIVIPKISGLELLKKIKSSDPDSTVIMVSSYATQQSIKQAKELNANWFLKKPFTKRRVLEIIERFERN